MFPLKGRMCQLWRNIWVSSMSFLMLGAETATPPTQASINLAQPRALNIEGKQDDSNYQSSYYPYQQQYPSGPYPPPTYGPPPPPLPQGMVRIEFAFDEIVLRCIAEEPFEHIVWTKHQCPQQILFGGDGVHVADGSSVHEDDLYDVHIRGHDGTIISELLIKNPLADNSEGIYQCEAWPHIHGGGGYFPFNPYQNYNPPKSEVFIIGGNSLLEDCYHVNNLGTPTNKLSGIANKQSPQNDKDIKFKEVYTLKPRRNTTDIRKDSSSKQLRYNLKFVNDSLYNVEGVNVTADFFRPSKNIPFNLQTLHNNLSKNMSFVSKSPNYFPSSDYFTGRNNDKFREIFPKLNARQGKVADDISHTLGQDKDKNAL